MERFVGILKLMLKHLLGAKLAILYIVVVAFSVMSSGSTAADVMQDAVAAEPMLLSVTPIP
jgi:hypothetical protein